MDKLLQKLAGYIVAELFAWLGVKTPEELLTKATAAVRAEFAADIATLEAAPEQMVDKVLARLPNFNDLPGQIVAAIKRGLPFPFNQ